MYRNLEFVSFGQNEAAFSMILLFVVSYANKTGYNYDFFLHNMTLKKKKRAFSTLTSLPWAGDVFVSLTPDGSARWCEEGDALILGAPLGLQHVNCDFVLAGEQQAREVDVVLLSQETYYLALMTLTCHPGQVPWSFRDN